MCNIYQKNYVAVCQHFTMVKALNKVTILLSKTLIAYFLTLFIVGSKG
jgi:hypothetical protein